MSRGRGLWQWTILELLREPGAFVVLRGDTRSNASAILRAAKGLEAEGLVEVRIVLLPNETRWSRVACAPGAVLGPPDKLWPEAGRDAGGRKLKCSVRALSERLKLLRRGPTDDFPTSVGHAHQLYVVVRDRPDLNAMVTAGTLTIRQAYLRTLAERGRPKKPAAKKGKKKK